MERRFTRWVDRVLGRETQPTLPSASQSGDATRAREMALDELAAMDPHTSDAVRNIREGRPPGGRLTRPRTGDSPYLSVLVNDPTARTVERAMDTTGRTLEDVVNQAIQLLGKVPAGVDLYVSKRRFGRRRIHRL